MLPAQQNHPSASSIPCCRTGRFEAAKRIQALSPATMVLMISIDDTEQSVLLALAAGARGYIVKSETAEHLATAVLALAQTGQPYFTPQLTPEMWPPRGFFVVPS
jgi:DNA-binding NarL/FixJ family response regulator